MSRTHKRIRFSCRTPKEHFSASVSIPRWITIPFILIVGLIIWVGVLSDSTGSFTGPDLDSILYVVAVIGVVLLLAYADRRRNGAGKKPKKRSREGDI